MSISGTWKKIGMTNISIKIVFLGLGTMIRDSKWIVLASCLEKVSLPPSLDNFEVIGYNQVCNQNFSNKKRKEKKQNKCFEDINKNMYKKKHV